MIALDSSVALPGLHPGLPNHSLARPYLSALPALPAHSAIETYSAMTRLPDPYRVDPATAARLLASNFGERVLAIPPASALVLWLERVAAVGISGGAIYDALIAESARLAGATLVTADRRAAATYRAVGVEVEMLGV